MKRNGGARPEQWINFTSSPSAEPGEDAAALSLQVSRCEAIVSELPPKADRTRDQHGIVGELRESCRRLRKSFMRSHAAWLYNTLTAECTAPVSLEDLAVAAARIVPGLVPTPGQMADEQRRLQSDKEGFEIDQGIFFSGLFSLPEAGCHLIKTMQSPTGRARALLDSFRAEGRLDLGPIRIDRAGFVAHLAVQNDGCLNAEDNDLAEAMETAVDLALLDEQVRVAVLRGGPMSHPRYRGRRVFNAGINLKYLPEGKLSFVNFFLRRELGYINKIFRGLRMSANEQDSKPIVKPWIAAVDAFAIGGGAQLLFVFDRVIAASDAYVSLPAATEGIIPGMANLRLTRTAGGRLSRQVILAGRKIRATEGDARFFFDEIVEPENMEEAIDAAARQLSADSVVANRELLNSCLEPMHDFRIYLAEFSLEQARRLYSPYVLNSANESRGNASERRSLPVRANPWGQHCGLV